MKAKRILSVILALAMVISCMGFTAFAEETTATTEADLKTALAVGGTVVLGNDIMVSSQIDIPTGVTAVLDLSGHKITSGYQENSNTKHIYPISNNGVLTIIDNSEEKTGSISGRGIYNQNGGVLTLTDVKVTAEDWNGGACIWAYGTAKTYLNNCTMIGNTGVVSSEDYLEINGGTYTCYSGVDDDGNQITSPTYNIRAYNGLKITDGTFTSRHGVISLGGGEGVIEKGTFTVESVAKITSNVVYVKDNAELTIKNGSFTFANDNGDSGAAVLVEGDEASVSIDGGTFVGLNGMVSINDNTVINGGSFNTLWDYNHYGSIESAVALGATVTVAGTDMTKTENGLETLPAWDGVTIASLKDLKAFRDAVNAGDTYAGKTVTLTADIDLANEDWEPIGTSVNTFNGYFDGGNHTIYNLTINGDKTYVSGGNNDNNKGLFGYMKGGNTAAIKNLTIENAKVSGCLYVGAILGHSFTGGIIENCHVTGDVAIDGYEYIGGIVGRHDYSKGKNINGTDMSIYNCSVVDTTGENGTVNGDYSVTYAGGIVGFMGEGDYVIDSCKTENITVSGVYGLGGISGIGHYGNTVSNSTVDSVVVISQNNDPESIRTNNVGLIVGAVQGTKTEPTVFTGNTVTETTGNVTYTDSTTKTVTEIYGTSMNGSTPVTNYVAKIGDVYYNDIQEAIKAAAPSGTVDIIADITVDTWNMFSQSKTIGNGKIITLEMDGLTINGNGHSLTVKSVESAQNGGYLFDDPDNFTIRDLTINVENNGGIGLKSGTVDNVTFNGGNCIFPGTGKVTITNCTFNTDGHVIYYEDARDNLTVKNNTFNVDSASNVIILYGNETFTGNKINSGRTVNAAGGSSPTISGNTFAEGVRLKVYNTSTADIYGNTITVLAFNDETPVLATFENNTMSEAAQAVLDSADLATLPNAEVVDLGAITIDEYSIYNGSLTDGGDPIDLQVAMEFIAKDTPEEAAANAFSNYTTDFFISFEGMANDSFVADGCYLAGNYGTFGWIMIPLDGMTIEEGVIYPVITSVGFDFSYEDICTSVKDFKCGIYFSDEVIAANPDLKVKLELGLSEDIDAAQAAEFITVDEPYVYAAEDFGYVAKIGETKFATLQDAVDAATDGQTITMIATANLDSTVIVGKDKNIILDINGKNINTVEESEGKHFYAFNNNGTLTVKDTADGGEINARGNYNYGKMIVEGGTINAIDGNGGYGVRNYNGASLTVSGGKIATTLEDDNKVDEGGYDATPIRIDEGATLEMNAGEINNICDYTFGIENYGTTTIEGGSVTTVHTTLANYGDMTINGGTFTNKGLDGVTAHVVWAADGNTTINGGTFDGKDNYNGFNIDASEGAVVNISGGEFKAVHSGSLYGDGTIAVSGGSFFDKIPEERIASGFVLEANSDGTYGVKENWLADTDAGCYGDKSVGMMRFMFMLGINEADVEESGIKYIAGNDIEADVKGCSETGTANAFYGDVVGVPESEKGNAYYAMAYIKTKTGKTYWSNPLGCTVSFEKFFSDYTGGAQ